MFKLFSKSQEVKAPVGEVQMALYYFGTFKNISRKEKRNALMLGM